MEEKHMLNQAKIDVVRWSSKECARSENNVGANCTIVEEFGTVIQDTITRHKMRLAVI